MNWWKKLKDFFKNAHPMGFVVIIVAIIFLISLICVCVEDCGGDGTPEGAGGYSEGFWEWYSENN